VLVASSADWAQLAVTALLGVVTVVVGVSIHLRRRQEVAVTVAKKRFDAYAALWQLIPYSPETRKLRNDPPLSDADRTALFDRLTQWYYSAGNGMLLATDTRELYLTVKKNLICDAEEFVPAALRGRIRSSDAERSSVCVRQLSLLRSTMRADIEVFGRPWGKPLDEDDRAFLLACGVRTWRLLRTRRDRLRERLRVTRRPAARRTAPDAPAPVDA
jgi:hypothetical protein